MPHYFFYITNVAGAALMQSIAAGCVALAFLTNIHQQVSLLKACIIFNEFLRLLDYLIEKGGRMVTAQHERNTPTLLAT